MDDRRQLRILRRVLIALGVWMLLIWALYSFSLIGGNRRLQEVEKVAPWFEQHKEELFEVRDLLLPRHAIHRVSVRQRPNIDHLDQYGQFSEADEAAYATAVAIMRKLQIGGVVVWRLKNDIYTVDFTLWHAGLAISGYAIVLMFSPEWSPLDWRTPPSDLKILEEKGWYAFKSSSD